MYGRQDMKGEPLPQEINKMRDLMTKSAIYTRFTSPSTGAQTPQHLVDVAQKFVTHRHERT